VINGGDGANEHPSQALLDLYTIRSELVGRERGLDGLRIAMVGDLRFGRTVHSLSKLLSLFEGLRISLVSPEALSMPEAVVETLREAGHEVLETDVLETGIADVDIVYSTRIQEERFASPEEADLYRGRFRLNQSVYTANCEPNTVIMHPLPRDSREGARELDIDLNDNPNLAIFRQSDNGVLGAYGAVCADSGCGRSGGSALGACELVHGASVLTAFRLRYGAEDVDLQQREQSFRGYFSLETLTLRHRLFEGGWSAPMRRELFQRGDAVGVLPWDPETDELGAD
jgi:hypothetical protein